MERMLNLVPCCRRVVPSRSPEAVELPLSEVFEMEQYDASNDHSEANRETPIPPVKVKDNRENSGQRSLLRRVFSTRGARA
jgi:hypothetical protein